MTKTYWCDKGKHQALYKVLQERVPVHGGSTEQYVELIRCLGNVYYDLFNNGGCNLKSGTWKSQDWKYLCSQGFRFPLGLPTCTHRRQHKWDFDNGKAKKACEKGIKEREDKLERTADRVILKAAELAPSYLHQGLPKKLRNKYKKLFLGTSKTYDLTLEDRIRDTIDNWQAAANNYKDATYDPEKTAKVKATTIEHFIEDLRHALDKGNR